MQGTINNRLLVIIKDIIKGMYFIINFKHRKVANKLTERIDSEIKFQIIDEIIGVHQVKTEIIEFSSYLKTNLPEAKTICEIGTANSGTTLFLGCTLESVKEIICIDLYIKNKIQLNYILSKKKIALFQGSSYEEQTLNKVKHHLRGNRIDILFIDGDHTFNGVSKDFEMYFPLVKEGGIIAFHDIVPDYLSKFGKNTGMWVGDVPKFWEKIKDKFEYYEIIENSNQDGKGIGIIRKEKLKATI